MFLTIYLVMALIQGEVKFALYEDKDTCEQSVEAARGREIQVTDCIPVDVPRPSTRG